MDYLPMNSNQLVKVAFLKKRLDNTLCNSFKASRERKVFLGTDEVKASSTSLEVQFWKSCKNAKENSLRCCFTSIKYLVAYSKPSSSLKLSDFPRLSINTQTVRSFVRDGNDEKQSFALRKLFLFCWYCYHHRVFSGFALAKYGKRKSFFHVYFDGKTAFVFFSVF